MLLDRVFKRRGVGANNLAHLLPVLEQHERRHRADVELLCYVRDVIDVELVEACVGVLVGEPGAKRVSTCLRLEWTEIEYVMTYLTTCGAMTLHGPHQVAKQSTTMRVSLMPIASSNSDLDLRL